MSAEKPFHHGNLRNALLDAVRDLVETQGPAGVTIAEAARRANVSSAAPYKHFKDRGDLLRSTVCSGMDRLRDKMLEAGEGRVFGSMDHIAALGLSYITFARTEPGMFRLMFGLMENEDASTALAERGRATFGIVVSATAAYYGSTPTDQKTAQRAYQLWTAVHGHSFLSIDKKVNVSDAALTDEAFAQGITKGILEY